MLAPTRRVRAAEVPHTKKMGEKLEEQLNQIKAAAKQIAVLQEGNDGLRKEKAALVERLVIIF